MEKPRDVVATSNPLFNRDVSGESPPVPGQGNQRRSDVRDASAVHNQTIQESEEIEELRRELRELQKHCEAQSRDLDSSNSFLNTADKCSDLDVIRAVQKLNAEVQQSTTYMTDCLVEEFKFQNISANELDSTAQRFSERIGHILVNALRAGMEEEIPMLLQIAFQAYLVTEFCRTISSWTLGSYNSFIVGVYEGVCRSVPQAVSGRWRMLTRDHINKSYTTHSESPIEQIIEDLSDILLITGCTATRSVVKSKIMSSFEKKIASLVELAGSFDKILDGVISSDYEVFIGQPGEKFVDDIMEDTDGGQVVAEEGKVLCTTHLGLSKQVPLGTLWDRGEKQRMTVLKTKVLLESLLIVDGGSDLGNVSTTAQESKETEARNKLLRFPVPSTARDNIVIRQHGDAEDAAQKGLQEQLENKDRIIAAQKAEIEEWKAKYAVESARHSLSATIEQQHHVMESEQPTVQVEEWERSDTAKAEQPAVALRDLGQLRPDLAMSTAQIADSLRCRHVTESTGLTSELEESKHPDGTKAQNLATAGEKVVSLENHLSTSSSRIIELEQQDGSRPVELSSLREQPVAMSSAEGDRDRAVPTLDEEITERKQVDGHEAEETTTLREELDSVQRDLDASANYVAKEQQRHATESTMLTSKIEERAGSDAGKAGELINVREQSVQPQKVDSTSSTSITELDQQTQKLPAVIDSVHAKHEVASSYNVEGDHIVANLTTEG